MKKVMMFIFSRAIVLLFSMTLNAQSDSPTLNETSYRKNVFSYDLVNGISDYAPINLSYERSINPTLSITTSVGLFHTSKNDGLSNNVVTEERFNNTSSGSLAVDLFFGLLGDGGSNPYPPISEFNQKGSAVSFGLKIYPNRSLNSLGNGSGNSFFVAPEVTLYSYKTDVQRIRFDDYQEGDKYYTDRITTINRESKSFQSFKLNLGWQMVTARNITFDLSGGFGAMTLSEDNKSDYVSKKQFGTVAMLGSLLFDAKLKVGYQF